TRLGPSFRISMGFLAGSKDPLIGGTAALTGKELLFYRGVRTRRVHVLMPKTTTDLYRRGNASGPRMAHVRLGKDIVTFPKGASEWVAARSGGVSTISVQGPGTNWWCLPAGFDYPDE